MIEYSHYSMSFVFCFTEGSTEFLKENLIDELEYALVPEEGWNKLYEWYGLVDGQVSSLLYIFVTRYHVKSY